MLPNIKEFHLSMRNYALIKGDIHLANRHEQSLIRLDEASIDCYSQQTNTQSKLPIGTVDLRKESMNV